MRVSGNTKFGILMLLLSGTFLTSGAMANSNQVRRDESLDQKKTRWKREREERRKQREQEQRIIQANKIEEQNRKQQEKEQKVGQEKSNGVDRDRNNQHFENEPQDLVNRRLQSVQDTLKEVMRDTKIGNEKLEKVRQTLEVYKNS